MAKARKKYLSSNENLSDDILRSHQIVPRVMNDLGTLPVFISKNYLDSLNVSKSERKTLIATLQDILFKTLTKRRSTLLDIDLFVEDYEFEIDVNDLHVDVNKVDGSELDIEAFRNWREEYKEAVFICEDGSVNSPLSLVRGAGGEAKYICGAEVEKMSKSKYNTVNPDELCNKYGADTFRMYEMFLGPVEASKPWDTKGIEGVHRFLRKLWRLFYDDIKGKLWNEEKANDAEIKILHRTIKKIEEDTERFSFNTAVSTFMIAVNELADINCHKKGILQPLLILLAPYAPHISEELYDLLESSEASPVGGGLPAGQAGLVGAAKFPTFDPKYLVESSKEYPISINGKLRTNIAMALDLDQQQVEAIVLQNEIVQKWLEGKDPKKIIFVKNKMVNIVI